MVLAGRYKLVEAIGEGGMGSVWMAQQTQPVKRLVAVKLIKAGVTPERIAPGKPQQNGRHERMHLTLLQEVANPPAYSMREQLKRLREFQQMYNEERPHQALDNTTPAERYQVSPRRFDGILRSPDYGDQDVRWVRHNGEIKLDGRFVYINAALVGEPVGLAETEDGCRTVSYGPIMLGTIAYRTDELRKPKRKGCGPWGQRSALSPGPTAPATTDLNETRIVLPMSSV